MKIYFGFTVAGDRSTIDTARKVVQLLEDLGHEVLTRHLVSDNAWEADRSISPQDVFRRDGMARSMRSLHRRSLGVFLWAGVRDGLPFRLNQQEGRVALLPRGGNEDLVVDYRKLPRELYACAVCNR